MNARSDTCPVASAPIGVGTHVRAFLTQSIVIPAGNTGMLIFNAGGGNTIAKLWLELSGTLTSYTYTVDALMYSPTPEDFSVRRGTLELTDVTQLLNRGGVVRVWNTSQSINGDLNGTTYAALANAIVSDPHARTFGTELSTVHAWDSHVANFARYETFRDFANTTFPVVTDDPGLSNIVVYFETYGNARTFMMGLGVGALTRYDSGSVLSRMARPIPVTPMPAMVAANNAMVRQGSNPSRVGVGAPGRGARGPKPGRVPQPRMNMGAGRWA